MDCLFSLSSTTQITYFVILLEIDMQIVLVLQHQQLFHSINDCAQFFQAEIIMTALIAKIDRQLS